MHITKVELQNFKRFTDLTIDGIPADAKLVLLIGSNGSGKSSIFDAFELENSQQEIEILDQNAQQRPEKILGQDMYVILSNADFIPDKDELRINNRQNLAQRKNEFKKSIQPLADIYIKINMVSAKVDVPHIENRVHKITSQPNRFYGRTSFRQLPRLVTRQIDYYNADERDSDRPLNFTDRDNRFEADIDRISRQIFQDIFRNGASSKEIKNKYIEPINQAFERIFDSQLANSLSLIEFIPPGEGQATQVNFKKGESEIAYDYLSAGEKEIFNILFNLLVRRDQFTDTIYFFDELDLHLNTKLQFNLLKEITENWIPENCQLWTASHSLGFIDYARQYEKGVIIDFDDLDFDQPQTLFPKPKDRLDVYDIAVPKEMLFEIMKDKKIVLCENLNAGYYNLLALPDTLFVGLKDARSLFVQIKNDARYFALRDRDFLSDTEIERLEKNKPHYRILRYYDFENYLYHPDNIAELSPEGFDKKTYIAEIIRQKNDRFNSLLLKLNSSRSSYAELQTDGIMDKTPDSIVDDLQSDDFDRFYKYFDMKDTFKRVYLERLNLDTNSLVQTAWFRQQIEAILNR